MYDGDIKIPIPIIVSTLLVVATTYPIDVNGGITLMNFQLFKNL